MRIDLSIPNRDRLYGKKYVYMKPLNGGFWEFFPIDSMLLAEREVDSDFSFMEIDIGEGSGGGYGWIESESQLTNHDFSLIRYDPIVELLEWRREIRRGKYPPMLNTEFEWERMID